MSMWYDAPIVVVDFESTGFSKPRHIVEIGVVRYEGAAEVDRYHALVRPGRRIEPGASKVHGLKDRDVANAPTFVQRYPELAEILEQAVPASFGGFDRRLLHEELDRMRDRGHHVDEQVPAFSREWGTWLDLLGWARHLHPAKGKGQHTLANMTTKYGIELQKSHRALSDAVATGELLWAFREHLPEVSLSDLLKHYQPTS